MNAADARLQEHTDFGDAKMTTALLDRMSFSDSSRVVDLHLEVSQFSVIL